jgi:hypothetical protein
MTVIQSINQSNKVNQCISINRMFMYFDQSRFVIHGCVFVEDFEYDVITKSSTSGYGRFDCHAIRVTRVREFIRFFAIVEGKAQLVFTCRVGVTNSALTMTFDRLFSHPAF